MYIYKNKILPIISICLILMFFVQHTFHAHNENAEVNNHKDIVRLKDLVQNHETHMDILVGNYNSLQSNMGTLIGQWNANEDAVASGNKAALAKTSIAILSAVATISSAVLTGGSTLALAPAIYLAILGAQDAVEANNINSSEYVEAMGTVLSLMDDALTEIETAYKNGGIIIVPKTDEFGKMVLVDGIPAIREVTLTGYVKIYNEYLTAGATHTDMTFDSIFEEVQRRNGRVGYDSQEHSFLIQYIYHHYPEPALAYANMKWKTIGLPKDFDCDGKEDKKNYTCKGTCDDMFRSPHEAFTFHRIQWGDCGIHQVTDDTRILHAKLTPLDRCPNRQDFRDLNNLKIKKSFQCTETREFACEAPHSDHHPWHDYNTSPGATYPDGWGSVPADDSTADSTPTTPSYHVCASHQSWQSGEHSAASCGQSGHFVCDSLSHVEEQCTTTNTNGGRCTYTFWRCVHPNVPSYGPSHIHTYPVPPPPAVFTPSLSLTYNSSTGSVSLVASANEPIYGAHLYVRSPGDYSTYGTQIDWYSGSSTSSSLSVSYTFPVGAASGTYKFTLRVYPWEDGTYGDPDDVFENVTVD